MKIKVLGAHGKSPKGHRCTKWCGAKCMCGKTIHVDVSGEESRETAKPSGPCSACGDGDTDQRYHTHAGPAEEPRR